MTGSQLRPFSGHFWVKNRSSGNHLGTTQECIYAHTEELFVFIWLLCRPLITLRSPSWVDVGSFLGSKIDVQGVVQKSSRIVSSPYRRFIRICLASLSSFLDSGGGGASHHLCFVSSTTQSIVFGSHRKLSFYA